jgi:hypothetical protein
METKRPKGPEMFKGCRKKTFMYREVIEEHATNHSATSAEEGQVHQVVSMRVQMYIVVMPKSQTEPT